MSLKQVAEVAGVSVSTVSRVLNGKSHVSKDTRRRVDDAISLTNYQPNILAQSLKVGRSNTICLIIPSMQNLIFPEIAHGVEEVARKNGRRVFLCNSGEDVTIEKDYIEDMKSRLVDGFIVCSLYKDGTHIRRLREEGYPVVLVNRYEEQDVGNMDIITSDNFQIGYDATMYLINTGHRRIAYAQGRENLNLYRERLHGYRKALEDSGIPYREELIMYETHSTDSFYYETKKLMAGKLNPDAIFCSSDPKAFVIMHALHDLELRIPEDIAVIGVDGIYLSSLVEPPLSTISQRPSEMGEAAANNLIRQIDYKEQHGSLPKPEYTVLPSDLIVRRSTMLSTAKNKTGAKE